MDRAEVVRRRDELSEAHGAWHDRIALGDGVYTVSDHPRRKRERIRVRSILQSAADGLAMPLGNARVLDLGAAEAVFAVEFALHGAEVLAFEGRAANVERIGFVRDALHLERSHIAHQDVRELSRDKHGEFDVVLCLGLLYHLESASAASLAHKLADVCRRLAIVDTHIALKPKQSTVAYGHTYAGRIVREFDPGSSAPEVDRLSRVSIGNPESIWFTGPSLYNLLEDAGFTSVLEVRAPRYEKHSDRVTLVAFKGVEQDLASADGDGQPRPRWPERSRTSPHPSQTIFGELKRRLAPWTPHVVKAWVIRGQERHQESHRP
jgi:2-polyprenyl-3-methyl-5-hydroxy-6-metoxy-1,4-benzoquinol methylase